MKSNVKAFLAGALATAVISTTTMVFAESSQTIQAIFGRVKLVVNNKSVEQETLLYDGTTYVPLRAVGEMLDLEIDWVDSLKTAYLKSNDTQQLPEKLTRLEPAATTEKEIKEVPRTSKHKPYINNVFSDQLMLVSYLQNNYAEFKYTVNNEEKKLHLMFGVFEEGKNYVIRIEYFPVPVFSFEPEPELDYFSWYLQGNYPPHGRYDEEYETFVSAIENHMNEVAEDLNLRMPESNLFGYYYSKRGGSSVVKCCWSNYGVFDSIQKAQDMIEDLPRQEEVVFFEAVYVQP